MGVPDKKSFKRKRLVRSAIMPTFVGAILTIGCVLLFAVQYKRITPGSPAYYAVNRMVNLLTAHAQSTSTTLQKRRNKLREYLTRISSIDDLIKRYGQARVLVKYKNKMPNIPAPSIATQLWYWIWKQVGIPAAAPPRALGTSNFVRKDVTPAELVALSKDPEIDFVFPDIPIPPALSESGPFVRTDMEKLKTLPQRPARQTHAVVVLDTGIDSGHPFLKGSIIDHFSACYSTEQLSPPYFAESLCPGGESIKGKGVARPCDSRIPGCDHGTHIAGIISGWAGRSEGTQFHGVTPRVPIISVQIYSKITADDICVLAGMGAPCVMSFLGDQIAALNYAGELHQRGVAIGAVNLSASFGVEYGACDQLGIASEISNLSKKHIPVVIAAGNNGDTKGVGIPGCVSGAITVAATDDKGNLAVNFPGGGGSNFADLVDIAAPGVDIVSSVPGNGFKSKSGTSMAAPHVAGILARIRALRQDASINDLLNAVQNFSIAKAVHPINVALMRPVVRYSDQQISQFPMSSALAFDLAVPADNRTFQQLISSSNRIIIDYGNQSIARG